jgi:uncharacterized membrane protein
MRVVPLVVICGAWQRGAKSRKRERWKARVGVMVAVLIGWRINCLFALDFHRPLCA